MGTNEATKIKAHKATGLYTCAICKMATTKRWIKGEMHIVHEGNTTRRSAEWYESR